MMFQVLLQISIAQLKALCSDYIFKKFIRIIKSDIYIYYLVTMLLINLYFSQYYIRLFLSIFMELIDLGFLLFYRLAFLGIVNYVGLYYFDQIFEERELEAKNKFTPEKIKRMDLEEMNIDDI